MGSERTSVGATAAVLPFKRNAISLETQHVIDTLEGEIANLRSGKVKAEAVIVLTVEGDATDIVYANLSHVEVIGTLHVAAASLAVER